MPIPGAPSDSPNPLGDLFANVNRPQLNAFVANSQARNGLLSAQTQEAMIKAAQAQEEQGARKNVYNDLIAMGAKPSEAMLGRDIGVGALGNAEVMAKAMGLFKLGYGTPDEQVRGHQMATGNLATPPSVPGNYLNVPGTTGAYAGAPPVQQTPLAQAQTTETNALAGLNTHRNLSPQDFKSSGLFANVPPEQQAALTEAVNSGRLDWARLNSRNAPYLAQIAAANPNFQFNETHATAALQSNPTFQQRAMGLEIMPGILQHVTQLGKQLDGGAGYSDIRTVGKLQQFANGEFNDPAYAEYMPVRNDALLRLAYLMRGQGASNQAAKMEDEAFSPTLAPYALDAWLKGQMSILKPMIEKNNTVRHAGEPGQPTIANPNPSGAASDTPAGPAPLSESIPTPQNAAPAPLAAPDGGIPHYANEAAARAAGHKSGDRVFLVDHNGSGTLD